MVHIPGYTIESLLIAEGPISLFDAVRRRDERPVLLKTVPVGTRGMSRIFREELSLLRKLGARGVIEALGLLRHEDFHCLVYERRDWVPLKDYLTERQMDPRGFLTIAIQLAATLSDVHNRGVIHKSIKPLHIFIEPDNLVTTLSGFDSAEPAQGEASRIYRPRALERALHYISPEQTGRIDREIDFRSDLYSLGITLYELATGQLPFIAEPLELIHMHLAVTPKPPHQINGEVPEQLSRIILELLEKDPDRRYQSAGGLQADLETARAMLAEEGSIDWFDLGAREVPTTLTLPTRMYGRHDDLRVLEEAYRKAYQGSTELVMISGPPGAGKSKLVGALRHSLVNDRIPFLRGSFERFQSNVPFAGVAHAVTGWLEQLLAGSDEELANWSAVFRAGLEGYLDVVCRVVPKLELVVRPDDRDPWTKTEVGNRTGTGMLELIRCMAGETPMILYLDDLQWADSASLAMIAALIDRRIPISCLLIVSHRTEGEPHPTWTSLERRALEDERIHHLVLAPWSDGDVNAFLADALGRSQSETLQLAELTMRKTGGNPQFVRQYLRHLYATGLVRFEVGSGWQWTLDAIAHAEIPDDIAGIMTEKIEKLPRRARNILEVAACVGRRFDSAILAQVSGMTEDDIAMELYTLTFEGLIAPSGSSYHFTHNRIFEAALELLPEESRARFHVKIGSLKLDQNEGNETLQRDIFEIVDHLNHGAAGEEDPTLRRRLAELNLKAGRKAMEAAAFGNAAVYFRTGVNLLHEEDWRECYALIFDLSLELAHNLFLAADYGKAADRFRELLARPLEVMDRARVVARYVNLYTLIGQPLRAMRAGSEGLAELGESVPVRAGRFQLFAMALRARRLMRGKDGDRLMALGENTDPRMLARMRIMVEMLLPAYLTSARNTIYLVLSLTAKTLTGGRHQFAPIVYTMYASLLLTTKGDLTRARNLCSVADALHEKAEDTRFGHRLAVLRHYVVGAWLKPYARCADALAGSWQRAIDAGDPLFGTIGIMVYWLLRFEGDGHLGELAGDLKKTGRVADQGGGHTLAPCEATLEAVTRYLHQDQARREMDRSDDPFALEPLREEHARLFYLFCMPPVAMACYLFGRYREAYELAGSVSREVYRATIGGQSGLLCEMVLALAAAALYPDADPGSRAKLLRGIDRAIKNMGRYAERCRANFGSRHQLLSAERARLDGRIAEAFHGYARAAEQAVGEGVAGLRGLVEERRATLAMREGMPSDAATYLSNALEAYRAWGAHAKVAQIRALYGSYLREQHRWDSQATSGGAQQGEGQLKSMLDLETVLESSLAISREVRLSAVLDRVIASTMENAGARRAVLILRRAGGLIVAGEACLDNSIEPLAIDQPLDEQDPLPHSIIKYVRRTGETVVLGDAARQGLFKDDPYIAESGAQSVLGLPIVHQSKQLGVLYLENDLVGNAFNEDRVEVLQLIAAQAGVSIENANLYDQLSSLNRELEGRVEERTNALQEANQKLTQEIEDRIETQKELVETQSKLLESARRAGMTEVAIGVLHNVGNVLNSITISVDSLAESLKNTKLPQLGKTIDLLEHPEMDFVHFFTEDPRGKILPNYLAKLREHLEREHAETLAEVKRMTANLSHVIEVIRAQQDHARMRAVLEPVSLADLFEQGLKISGLDLAEREIEIVRDYDALPTYLVEKHKILQILVNLLKNAGESMRKIDRHRELEIGLHQGPDHKVVLTVSDNGVGIAQEDLTNIFSYGFTTRDEGHGFGLHNAANAATEMGGSLKAFSDGPDKGATFVLVLPLRENNADLATIRQISA